MKKFDALFAELSERSLNPNPDSKTTNFLTQGPHEIGKKIVEEAGELWLALEHESPQRVAAEAAQLIYFIQLALIARGATLADLESAL